MKKLLLAACALVACTQISKAQLYWDSNGATAGTGATTAGTWGLSAFWSTSALGDVATGAWTQGEIAIFSAGTTAGTHTVTVGGTTNSASRLVIEEGTPTFNGGTLTLTGDATVEVASGRTAILGTTVIAGSGGLTKEGPGTLQINNALNTYTGNTTVKAGTLTAGASAPRFGNLNQGELILDGGKVRVGISTTIANQIRLQQDGEIFGDASSGTRAATLTSGFVGTGALKLRHTGLAAGGFSVRFRKGDLTVDRPIQIGQSGDVGVIILRCDHLAGGDQILTGDITGPGKFERNSAGLGGYRTILRGNNTYSGGTDLRGGFIGIGSDTALGTGPIVVGQDPNLLGFFADGSARTITNSLTFEASTVAATNLLLGHGEPYLPLTFSGPITLHPNNPTYFYPSNGMVATFSGNVTGLSAAGLVKRELGTLILSGNNSYPAETVVEAGTLLVNGTTATAGTVQPSGTLGGSGTLSGTVLVSGTIAPGNNTVGSFSTGGETWAPGGTYIWQMSDATGAAGSGWDQLNVTDTVDIAAFPGSEFNIDIRSLNPGSDNFSANGTYSWTILTTANGVLNFSAANFNLITSSFGNSLGAGAFSLELANGGKDLVLKFVSPHPTFTTQPESLVVAAGATAQFSVVAAGDPAPTYSWLKNGSPIVDDPGKISGAETATLTISNAAAGDESTYTAVASNLHGSTNSTTVNLTVVVVPTITSEPDSVTVNAGQNAEFSVEVTGETPMTFAWKLNGSDVVDGPSYSGATTDTLTVLSASQLQAGTYTVAITNASGDTLSTGATLTVIDPPALTTPLSTVEVTSGQTASFTVGVSGTEPLVYSWKKNGDDIAGETTATLNLGTVNLSHAGSYSVTVTNQAGTVTSTASLIVNEAPAITAQPKNRYTAVGSAATFRVTATGFPAVSYQWAFNGAPISGATASAYTIATASTADIGFYSVTVTNTYGTVTSSDVTLSLFNPIYWESFDEDSSEEWDINASTIGDNAGDVFFDFSAIGIATAPRSADDTTLGAKLEANFGPTAPATAPGTSISPMGVNLTGDFVIKADVWQNFNGPGPLGGSGSTQLAGAALGTGGKTPVGPVAGTSAPLVFAASSEGQAAADFQILISGALLADQATNYAATGAINRDNSNPYYVARFPAGQTAPAAQIALYPQQTGGTVNGALGWKWREWTIRKEGDTVRWFIDGHLIGTVNTNSLNLDGNFALMQWDVNTARSSDANRRALAFGLFDNVRVLALDSDAPPVITAQPLTQTVNAGVPVTLSATVTSATTVRYQWQFNGLDISGATDSSYTISSPVKANEGSYRVFVANDASPLYSSTAALTVVDPAINTQPVSQTVITGSDVTLSVSAAGTALTYQWYKGVDAIGGATSSSLALEDVVPATSGDYTVVVSGSEGPSVTSDVAVLTVMDAPGIVTHPAPQTVDQGTPASFTVVASGSEPLYYQWLLDGNEIDGATDAVYSITNAQPVNVGSYTVVVTNAVGTVTGGPAALTITLDETAPVLKVVSPKANFVYTNSSLVISGTATDLKGVTGVSYIFNGIADSADYTAPNWTDTLTLVPGTNTLTVTAADVAGNTTSLSYKFYYHTASPLTIVKTLDGDTDLGTNHVGTVVNAIPSSLFSGNNTNLFVGRTYTLKVVEDGLPKFGFILTNWTATWVGQESPVVVQTNNLICTFEMKEGMVLKANFISNPFYRFGGTYLGLFSDTNGVAFHSAGYAQVKVTPKLTFSAKLLVDGNPVSIAGKLKIDGTGSATSKARLKVTDKPELTVDLALDFAGGTESLSGTVSEGETWTSELLAYRNVWSKTNVLEQAQAFTNNYTMQIPGFATLAEGPVGTASGGLKVDVRGKVVLNGVGSDMHLMKQATWISEEGHWPFFSPMYKVKRTNALGKLIAENRGFAMGWLQFTTNEFSNLRPEGEVHTIKTTWVNDLFTPGWTNSVYQGGFTNAADVVASRWAYDVLAPQNSLPGISGVVIDFFEGDLGGSLSGTWAVTPKATFAPIKGNLYDNSVKAALVPKTGVFKSTFIHPSNSAVTKYQGVMLQDYLTGAGTFVGPTNGGKVTVSQAPVGP